MDAEVVKIVGGAGSGLVLARAKAIRDRDKADSKGEPDGADSSKGIYVIGAIAGVIIGTTL